MGKVLNKKERYEKIKEAMDSIPSSKVYVDKKERYGKIKEVMDSAKPYDNSASISDEKIKKNIKVPEGYKEVEMKPVEMPVYKNPDDKSVKMNVYKNPNDKSVKMPELNRRNYKLVPKDTSRIPQFTKGGGIAIKGTKFKGVF